ncbi:hypothetical protein ATCC90586_000332 [Pythium insidiosum]|nr:hypothetical protein ATCC90586_000332 [Pythium insidiosum]
MLLTTRSDSRAEFMRELFPDMELVRPAWQERQQHWTREKVNNIKEMQRGYDSEDDTPIPELRFFRRPQEISETPVAPLPARLPSLHTRLELQQRLTRIAGAELTDSLVARPLAVATARPEPPMDASWSDDNTGDSQTSRRRPRFLGDIDRRIIIHRLDMGEKQAEVARAFGVTRAAVCHISKNRDEILTRFDILANVSLPAGQSFAGAMYTSPSCALALGREEQDLEEDVGADTMRRVFSEMEPKAPTGRLHPAAFDLSRCIVWDSALGTDLGSVNVLLLCLVADDAPTLVLESQGTSLRRLCVVVVSATASVVQSVSSMFPDVRVVAADGGDPATLHALRERRCLRSTDAVASGA